MEEEVSRGGNAIVHVRSCSSISYSQCLLERLDLPGRGALPFIFLWENSGISAEDWASFFLL